MTLIVAKCVDGLIYCVGDTKITYANNDETNPILNGCLKEYIFNNLLVCFSGSVHSFEQDIEKYRNCRNIDDIVEIASGNASEYDLLVASTKPCRIVTVKDKSPEESAVCYIGDMEAFESYQKYYHNPKPILNDPGRGQINIFQLPEPVVKSDDYVRMYQAFKEVVSESSVPSVNGAIVTTATHKGSFQYMMYCDIFTDEVVVPEPGESRTIGFGTKEGGGYSVEFSTCNERSGLGIKPAYYFLQGGFGILFLDEDNAVSKAHYVKALNPCHWALNTRKIVGEAVISGYLSLDHCGLAAENYIRNNDYVNALECYKLRIDSARKGNEDEKKLDRYFSGYYVCLFNAEDASRAIDEISDLIEKNPGFDNCKRYLAAMQNALTSR